MTRPDLPEDLVHPPCSRARARSRVAADPIAVVPALIAAAGDAAGWRYVEFFTANIRNPHTRRAYARACARFFAWCEARGLTLTTIRPHDVATYIEERQATHSAPDAKQQLAAVRMMFDWLIVYCATLKGMGPPWHRKMRLSGSVAPENP